MPEFLTVWISDPKECPFDRGYYVPDVVFDADPPGAKRYMCRGAHVALLVDGEWIGFSRDYSSPCCDWRAHPDFEPRKRSCDS